MTRGRDRSGVCAGLARAVLDLEAVPPIQRQVLREVAQYLSGKRAQGYLVGGFLRDYITGVTSDDIDVAVHGIDPAGLAGHLSRALGLSRPVVFPRFKTVLVVGGGIRVEVCELAGDLVGDGARRDFTVNCLYADLASVRRGVNYVDIADPTLRGVADVEAGLLRTPAEAVHTLWLDPLRILRAVRFHAARGYRMSSDLVDAMDRTAYLLVRVSPERIRAELERVLVSAGLESAMRLMLRTGVLGVIMPEVAQTDGFAQKTPYHAYDLFTHLVKTAAFTPPDVVLRLAALLHDVGKTSTQVAKLNRMVYYGHEKKSQEAVVAVMARLRFPNRSRQLASFLVGNHMINYSAAWSDRAVRRFMARTGTNLGALLTLAEADRRAQKPGVRAAEALADLSRRIRDNQAAPGHGSALPVDGGDIMGILGIGEGPLVGRAKAFLLEEATRKRGPMRRSDAVAALRKWSVQSGVRTVGEGAAGLRTGVDKPRGS